MARIFPWVDVGHDGWTYVHGTWKIVLHTTESNAGSIGGVESWYRQKSSAGSPLHPHITADPSTRTVHQHIDTNRACYALKNNAGGVHTNGARSINIEIVGRAAETSTWPRAWIEWLGSAVIAPIVRAHPSIDPANTPASGWPSSPSGYGSRTRWRMTASEWLEFNGICGHVHVPEGNAHSDPGAIDIATLTAAALAELGRATPKPKEPPVPTVTTPLPVGVIPTDRLDTNDPGLAVDERTRRVQELLNHMARSTGMWALSPGAEDGKYGPATAKSVRLFRELGALPPSGGEWDANTARNAQGWLDTFVPPGAPDRAPALAAELDAVIARYR